MTSDGVPVGEYSKHEAVRQVLKKTRGLFHKCMNVLCTLLPIMSFYGVDWKKRLKFILCNESRRGWARALRQHLVLNVR